jgi:hypothetical protein
VIQIERLLEETEALSPGFFILAKVNLVIPGVNVPRVDRCDVLQVTGVSVSQGTEYEGHAYLVGKSSDYSNTVLHPKHIVKFEYPIYFPPKFLISYIEANHNALDIPLGVKDLQSDLTPSTMWAARSIYQLFKNIREWSFMIQEPFNSDHPMAIYSKMVIDSLNPSQEILNEIDAMPDMHLAKFLKGQADYKQIPDHVAISQPFKDWILQISEQYPYKRFEEQL